MLDKELFLELDTEEKSEEEIKDEVRRAKLRALHLLTAMDRTEAKLREKLQASYCEEAVEELIKITVEQAECYGGNDYCKSASVSSKRADHDLSEHVFLNDRCAYHHH